MCHRKAFALKLEEELTTMIKWNYLVFTSACVGKYNKKYLHTLLKQLEIRVFRELS